MQALGVFTAATKLVVSNLITFFDKLLILKDLFKYLYDQFCIAIRMPICTNVVDGISVSVKYFAGGTDEKKATEVAY